VWPALPNFGSTAAPGSVTLRLVKPTDEGAAGALRGYGLNFCVLAAAALRVVCVNCNCSPP
jgi:hypothetical protein